MKNFFTSVLAIGVTALACLTASAQQPVVPKIYGLTNTTTLQITNGGYVTASASSNFSTVPIPLWRDRGFVFHLAVYTTNASGSNVNATLQLGNYHTNFASGLTTNWDQSLSFNFANNGTTEAAISTNIPKAIVDNYALVRMTSVTNNHLSTLFVDPTNSYIAVIP